MNFKPTSTKSIVSAFVPLILAVIAFKYKYCTDCDAEALRAQQQTIAAIVLIGLCIIIYVVWSIMEKQEQIYNN